MVKLFKLRTIGEEVLAKYEEDGEYFKLYDPVRLGLARNDGIAMMPLSPFMAEGSSIAIHKNDIFYTVEADPDIVSGYNSRLSGIVTPSSKLIT